MKILISIDDVRNNYRQLGKQVNEENFNGHVREVQENNLNQILGQTLTFDFYNFLENGFTLSSETFVRDSTKQLTATNVDLSTWVAFSLKINDNIYVLVYSAVFGGVDTIIKVLGYTLPTTLTKIEFSSENKYTKLLNGTAYELNNKTISFKGLRPLIIWHFLASYLIDGSLKQSDVGNINIVGANFSNASGRQISEARANYLENATRERNYIIDFLNENNSIYSLYEAQSKQNIQDFNFLIF